MTDTRLADISEFQPSFDADAYLKAGHKAIIARSHNGYRPDHTMPARRDYLRSKPFTCIGYYQYLAADRDPAAQAYDYIRALGNLRGNEFPICDLEEGSGDQQARARAWFSVVDPWAGYPATLYSGAYFLQDHLGGAAHWQRPVWIAAYGQSEPAAKHILWQYTDAAHFPGLAGGVDGNLYHGTAAQMLASMQPGKKTATPKEAFVAIASGLASDGTLHLFYEHKDGSVWFTYQKKGETSWAGGAKGKSVAALKPFAPKPGAKK